MDVVTLSVVSVPVLAVVEVVVELEAESELEAEVTVVSEVVVVVEVVLSVVVRVLPWVMVSDISVDTVELILWVVVSVPVKALVRDDVEESETLAVAEEVSELLDNVALVVFCVLDVFWVDVSVSSRAVRLTGDGESEDELNANAELFAIELREEVLDTVSDVSILVAESVFEVRVLVVDLVSSLVADEVVLSVWVLP